MPESQTENIRARYRHVLDQVAEAADKSGRSPDSVRVVVVTKTHPPETLRAAIVAGVREIGENYAEEAVEKMQAVSPAEGVRWHMIGHVQRRKAGLVAAHFDMVHSLDSLRLAERLNRFAGEAGRVVPVLLECNVSGEASKFGYPAWDRAQLPTLVSEVESIQRLPNLELRGLMTMPPYSDDAEQSRPFFRRLAELRQYLLEEAPGAGWNELSMGTSADFGAAVAEGATLVRVGTAILGPRTQA